MSKLFIYYSLSGNGDVVAQKLNELGFDLRKVNAKTLKKNNFWNIFKGGFLAGINHKAKLIDYNNDVSNYDEIYIGSPIWNGKFACPINTVLAKTDFNNKKLKFIFYSGSGEAKKVFKKINKDYPNAEVITLKEPKKHLEELDKLKGEDENEKR
ncbi:MAG: hypothetical protein K6F81_02025 [Acholeplasmatales bacterium]|nr:hypothetical protein [Acholeplasmatales bacterium]